MTKFCTISVPPAVMEMLEPVKHEDEAVNEIGCQTAADMSRKILYAPKEEGGVDGIHFCTLNLERSATRIRMSMGAFDQHDAAPTNPIISSLKDQQITGGGSTNHNDELSSSQQQQQPGGGGDGPNTANERSLQQLASSSTLIPSSRRHLPWRQSAMESRIKEDVRPINWANRPKSCTYLYYVSFLDCRICFGCLLLAFF